MDEKEYQVLVKLHQAVYRYLKEQEQEPAEEKVKFIPATMDANEILSVTDVLSQIIQVSFSII